MYKSFQYLLIPIMELFIFTVFTVQDKNEEFSAEVKRLFEEYNKMVSFTQMFLCLVMLM